MRRVTIPGAPITAAAARICLYEQSPFHAEILQPLARHLAAAGLEIRYVRTPADAVACHPRVLFHADRIERSFHRTLPATFFVFTRHGITSKNFFASCVRCSDCTLMSGEPQIAECRRRGIRPFMDFWPTGFPPMDILHARVRGRGVGAGNRPRTLLYLPTYDTCLAAEPVLGEDWSLRLLQAMPEWRILIRPHPHTLREHPEWMVSWRRCAAARPGQVVLADPSAGLFDLLPEAGLIVSDVSSAAFFSLPLNLPIVWVTNPHCAEDRNKFDPQGMEWTARNTGVEVHTFGELPAAVARALEDPDPIRKARQRLSQDLFGTTFDGRVAQRVEERVRRLLDPALRRQDYATATLWKKRLHGLSARWLPRFIYKRIWRWN